MVKLFFSNAGTKEWDGMHNINREMETGAEALLTDLLKI